jgi:hypothetical protein
MRGGAGYAKPVPVKVDGSRRFCQVYHTVLLQNGVVVVLE